MMDDVMKFQMKRELWLFVWPWSHSWGCSSFPCPNPRILGQVIKDVKQSTTNSR